jgi:FkbM family methyltransferase
VLDRYRGRSGGPPTWAGVGGTGEAADHRDVFYCYRLLLGREPDAGGWKSHLSWLANEGPSHQNLVRGFLASAEFGERGLLAPLATRPHTVVDIGEFRIHVAPDDPDLGGGIAKSRAYESHVAAAMRPYLRPGGVFIDIGASIGYFSLLAASRVGPTGRVLSFEPNPYSQKLLLLSRRLNGFENIELHPFALAERRGFLGYTSEGSNGQVGPLGADPAAVLAGQLVYATTLDEALPSLARADALKIDVEGAEHLALSGGRATIERCRPVIFTEVAPDDLKAVSGVSVGDYLRLLTGHGYDLSVIASVGELVARGRDVDGVVRMIGQSGRHHVDVLAVPAGRSQ